jgi:hypothetical protein
MCASSITGKTEMDSFISYVFFFRSTLFGNLDLLTVGWLWRTMKHFRKSNTLASVMFVMYSS